MKKNSFRNLIPTKVDDMEMKPILPGGQILGFKAVSSA